MKNESLVMAHIGYYAAQSCSIGWKLFKKPAKYLFYLGVFTAVLKFAVLPTLHTISGISTPTHAQAATSIK